MTFNCECCHHVIYHQYTLAYNFIIVPFEVQTVTASYCLIRVLTVTHLYYYSPCTFQIVAVLLVLWWEQPLALAWVLLLSTQLPWWLLCVSWGEGIYVNFSLALMVFQNYLFAIKAISKEHIFATYILEKIFSY